jgi:hypothetical protein
MTPANKIAEPPGYDQTKNQVKKFNGCIRKQEKFWEGFA